MQRIITSTLFAAIIGTTILMASCGNNNRSTETKTDSSAVTMPDSTSKGSATLKPSGNKPAWGPSIHPEMQAVIEKLASYNAPPIESLSADSARKNPTPADAIMALAKEHNIPIPVPQVDTLGKELPVAGGSIHARIYIPKGSTDSLPVIV